MANEIVAQPAETLGWGQMEALKAYHILLAEEGRDRVECAYL
jgi:hypothetical protein